MIAETILSYSQCGLCLYDCRDYTVIQIIPADNILSPNQTLSLGLADTILIGTQSVQTLFLGLADNILVGTQSVQTVSW